MQVNNTLTILDLSDNHLGLQGAAFICDALKVTWRVQTALRNYNIDRHTAH